MKHITVGDTAVKIILLRVNAGHEGSIVRQLQAYLNKEKKSGAGIIDYRLFKILGMYDIMILLHCRELGHDLYKMGTIDQVIHSNEILCFPFGDSQPFDLAKITGKAICISLLKFRLKPLLEFGKALHDTIAQYMGSAEKWFVLGSLGWNELVTIYPHSFEQAQLKDLFSSFLLETSKIHLKGDHEQKWSLIHKIYSFMGISYQEQVMEHLESSFPATFDMEHGDACPRLLISVTGPHFSTVYNSIPVDFKKSPGNFDYDPPGIMTGAYDMSVSFTKGSWGRFLNDIIKFRGKHPEIILDTWTELTVPLGAEAAEELPPVRGENDVSDIKFPKIILGTDETERILDRPGTTHIISTLYRFNNLLQNPLLQDSLLDLCFPADKLISQVMAKDKGKTWLYTDEHINELLVQLQWAIRERVTGPYLFIESDDLSFSPIKGGVHKVSLALASIPFSLLKLLLKREVPWHGFVSIGLKSEPMHFQENLHIPFEHALFPERCWWSCIHEIGHIFALLCRVLDASHPLVRNMMSKLSGETESAARNMADNCFADTFALIAGFLGDRSLYYRAYWPFLLDHIGRQDEPEKRLYRHLTRVFFGWVFERNYLKRKGAFDPSDYRHLISEARKFINNVNAVPNVSPLIQEYTRTRRDLPEYIANSCSIYLPLVGHFKTYLDPVLELQKKLMKEFKSPKFKKLVLSILEGRIVDYRDIKYPHLIPIKLMELMDQEARIVPFKARIATILSLYWYSHHEVISHVLNATTKSR